MPFTKMSFKKSASTLTIACLLASGSLSSFSYAQTSEQPMAEIEAPQTSDVVQGLIDSAMNGTQGYDFTRDLTTEIGARLAGSEAEARAREWTVERFKEIGLTNVRIEPFTVPGWVRGVETAQVVSPNPQNFVITALGGSVATPEDGVTADVVYFPTFEDLENAPEGGLDGKIVFISGRMDKARDGAGYGPANRKRRSGATEAGKRGAVAVIIRSVGTDSHRIPHTGQMRYAPNVAPIPIGALSAPDADQLERLMATGETIRLKLVLTPKDVGELPSGNVIGEIVGSERPEEIVLISGHLDSWDMGTGAIDDAAGVGIAAGAAKVILDAGLKPKRTIRVVAFGSEEIGLKGGFAYVDAHKATDLANHVLATESDFGSGPVYEVVSGVTEGEDVLRAMADAMNIPFAEDGGTDGGPDVGPMSEEGVPTMRFQQDGTDYFDLHHTPDDTFDKINPDEMAQNVAAFATMAWMASEAETDFRSDK